MALHNDFGKKGEGMAAEWLVQQGYRIIRRNWRHGRYEVDIIALLGEVWHFIEVKSAQTTLYGHPEEKVGKKKIRNLMKAASAWLHQFPGSKRVQYDVLSITIPGGAQPEYLLIQDVSL